MLRRGTILGNRIEKVCTVEKVLLCVGFIGVFSIFSLMIFYRERS